MPGIICGISRAVRRIGECENDWSLPDAHSRSTAEAIMFSAATARIPAGTAPGTPMQEIEPFCSPCTPAPLVTRMQRISRYSIDLPWAFPICTSEPVPEVNLILMPREA